MRHLPELLDDTDQRASPPDEFDKSPFGDIPGAIWTAFLSFWALLFGLFLMFFATDGPATLAVVTASLFAMMLLGLPATLGAQARPRPHPWPRTITTGSGSLPVGDAAIQILLIPVASVIGLSLFIILAL